MALRFMMRGGGRAAAEERPITIPRLETPRGAPRAEGLPRWPSQRPEVQRPAPAGKAARCPASGPPYPGTPALSQPPPPHRPQLRSLQHRLLLGSLLLGLPYSGLIAASPEGPGCPQRVVMKPGKGPREGLQSAPIPFFHSFLPWRLRSTWRAC